MLQLPEGDSTPLKSSPLELVVCQVRFEETLAVIDGRVILGIHGDLGGKTGRFRRVEPAKSAQVEFNMAAPIDFPRAIGRTGWRLIAEDNSTTATVMPDAVSLETLDYSTWTDFRGALDDLIAAVEKHVGPALEQRLGLRYVNRLGEPGASSPHEWKGRIAGSMLGAIEHPVLGDGVSSSQTQVELEIDESVRCLLRYGVVPDPGRAGLSTYVLDIDVYRQTVEPFNPSGIIETASQFNGIALGVFQQTLEPVYLTELREGQEAVSA
jgi:uncharacterized protein (TIGR04255 family)